MPKDKDLEAIDIATTLFSTHHAIPTEEKALKKESMKSLYQISLHLNRVRAIGNRTKEIDIIDTIIASLNKTKIIIYTTLEELDK